MSRSPMGAFAKAQETRFSNLAALSERASPLRSMRPRILSACLSCLESISAFSPWFAAAFFGCDIVRPASEAVGFFSGLRVVDIYPSSRRRPWREILAELHMGSIPSSVQ